jgi:hypothetical protein
LRHASESGTVVVVASYRLSRASMSRLSEAGFLPPRRIDVEPDGSAIAYYGEQPLAQYRSLDALLRFHRMTMDDLEAE